MSAALPAATGRAAASGHHGSGHASGGHHKPLSDAGSDDDDQQQRSGAMPLAKSGGVGSAISTAQVRSLRLVADSRQTVLRQLQLEQDA